jgi:hypothetical protein
LEIKQEVWEMVKTAVSSYSDIQPSEDNIQVTDSILTYFPCQNPKDINDRHAYLFSSCLCEILDSINKIYSLNLKFDFLMRQEWEIFKTIGHVYMYFIYLIEDRKE